MTDSSLNQFKSLYLEEIEDRLSRVRRLLGSAAARRATAGECAELARDLHTMKASSRAMGYVDVAGKLHEAEQSVAALAAEEFQTRTQAAAKLEATVVYLEQFITGLTVLRPFDHSAPDGGAETTPPGEVTTRVPLRDLEEIYALASNVRSLERHLSGPSGSHAPAAYTQLKKATSQLWEKSVDLRFASIEELFGIFSGAARTWAQLEDCPLALTHAGGDIAIERRLLKDLIAPITHIVRNCFDHGILPGYRERGAGKAYGLSIAASLHAGFLTITIENDGHPFDWAAVLRHAREHRLISEQEAAYYDQCLRSPGLSAAEYLTCEKQWSKLLLRGMFSSKEEITSTSGRGIGVRVVCDFIERRHAEVYWQSRRDPRGGTRCVLTVPCPAAAIPVVLLRRGTSAAALPLSLVERITVVSSGHVRAGSHGQEVILNGRSWPCLWDAAEQGQVPGSSNTHRTALVLRGAPGARPGVVLLDQVTTTKAVVSYGRTGHGGVPGQGSACLKNGRTVPLVTFGQ